MTGHFGPTLGPIVQTVHLEETWQGPLPSPRTLTEFQTLVPDAPERIFKQWEDESFHRRGYENRSLDGIVRNDRIGIVSAAVFSLSALALSAFALWLNQPWVAGILGSGTIGTVVTAFLYNRRQDGQTRP